MGWLLVLVDVASLFSYTSLKGAALLFSLCVCAPLIHWCQSIILMEFFFSSLFFFPAVIAHLIIFFLSEKMCCAQPIVAARWRRRFYNRTSAALIFSVVTCYFLFLKSLIFDRSRAHRFFFLYSIHNVARAIDLCILSHTVPIICTAAVRYSFGRGKKSIEWCFSSFFLDWYKKEFFSPWKMIHQKAFNKAYINILLRLVYLCMYIPILDVCMHMGSFRRNV